MGLFYSGHPCPYFPHEPGTNAISQHKTINHQRHRAAAQCPACGLPCHAMPCRAVPCQRHLDYSLPQCNFRTESGVLYSASNLTASSAVSADRRIAALPGRMKPSSMLFWTQLTSPP